MTIEEAIVKLRSNAIMDKYNMCGYSMKQHEQLAKWLEKLKYIENIILRWNADWYNEEDTGVPDNEILEAIFNTCTGNGFDINIDEDFRQGYNKAIDDFAEKFSLEISESLIFGIIADSHKDNSINDTSDKIVDYVIETSKKIAEQLKVGGNE